ncbi:THO complex subunit 3 [Eumeta japonica]|uniref:THO complex subunit 3 n=1 Tax=Eumeta variegata TaxID=151549 RepID=A0A4C1TZ38_EUMVA|nr:THO complex subunit 3 [Eumeta japonica]
MTASRDPHRAGDSGPVAECRYGIDGTDSGINEKFKSTFRTEIKSSEISTQSCRERLLVTVMKEPKQSQAPIEDLGELKNYFTTHNVVKEYFAHTSKVHSVGWSCDGKKLASGSFDKSVSIFTLERNRLVQDFVFRGHTGSVDQLCWHATHPDLLSTASGDKSVRIWDTRTHKCIATIQTKGENINIAWSPNGSTIAVGNKEDLVSFIDTKTYKVVEEQFNFEVNEISWNLTSDLFFLTNGLGCVHILTNRISDGGTSELMVRILHQHSISQKSGYDGRRVDHQNSHSLDEMQQRKLLLHTCILYPGLELQTVLKAHPGTCICIEHDPTGRYFATGSADALVSLWDVNELACLRVFSRLEWPVRTLSFSFDGRLLASASEDHVIDIGDTDTGEKVAEIPVQAATFTVAWHPSRYLLAFACEDKEPAERKRDAGNLKVWGFSIGS